MIRTGDHRDGISFIFAFYRDLERFVGDPRFSGDQLSEADDKRDDSSDKVEQVGHLRIRTYSWVKSSIEECLRRTYETRPCSHSVHSTHGVGILNFHTGFSVVLFLSQNCFIKLFRSNCVFWYYLLYSLYI